MLLRGNSVHCGTGAWICCTGARMHSWRSHNLMETMCCQAGPLGPSAQSLAAGKPGPCCRRRHLTLRCRSVLPVPDLFILPALPHYTACS